MSTPGGTTRGKADLADVGGGAIGRRRRAAQDAGGEEYHAKRREVIDTAATIFQEKGYQATTLADIATALDTDRATLYYYVSGKEELLREAVAQCIVEITDELRRIVLGDQPAPEKLRQLVITVMNSYETHYPHPYVFIKELLDETWHEHSDWSHQLMAMVAEIQGHVVGVLEQGIQDGYFRADVPVDLMANGVLGMINWTHRWYRPGAKFSGDEIGRGFAAMLLNGLLADPEP